MKNQFGFSIPGLVVAMLPLFINVLYLFFPPKDAAEHTAQVNKIIEAVEQVTRILYLMVICFHFGNVRLNWKSPYFYIGIVFLVLYYIVWMRFFLGGQEVSLMAKSFLFVPIPLAVFPVIYYLCGALWFHNYVAAVLMIIFGVTHYIVSYQSFS